MSRSDSKGDRMRDEFLAEAQEIVESLSRDLLMLEHAHKEGRADPDLVNEVFRGVHTLKGISGMFGYHQVGAVAHALEDLLEDLRLGRVELTSKVLDVLFSGVDNFQRMLSENAEGPQDASVDLDDYAQALEQVSSERRSQSPDAGGGYDLEASVLAVLTEYEEHRLRTNANQRVPLYNLKVSFSLAAIDSALEDLKTRAKPIAEIITYLPSVGGGEGEVIELDVLLASRAPLEQLQEALVGEEADLIPIPYRPGTDGTEQDRATTPPAASEEPLRPSTRGARTPPAPKPEATKPVAPEMSADQLSLRSVANTVRVDISKLDHLMNLVGELAIVRSSVEKMTDRIRSRPELRQVAIDLHRVNRGFERHLEELQDGILDVRMVPLGQIFDKLARVVRQVSRDHEKQIRLIATGSETEVDKLIAEELSDPLMHIIRNSIDHGIEPPKVRELAGKPPTGTLALNAFQKGNHVVIEVEDDGAGMHEETLLKTAVRKDVITEEASREISGNEILNLIFAPGFSTRSNITDLSGRGMGMDVVKTNIHRLGGIVDVQSEYGTSSKFTITLPITLAIISALLIEVAQRIYAVPLSAVQEALVLDPSLIRTVDGREVLTLRGSTLPLCRLESLFNLRRDNATPTKKYVVVTALGQRRLGFVVDALHGQQDIVIKPLGRSLSHVEGFAGATDLGDQRVVLVLDAPALLEEVLVSSERAALAGARA